MVGVPTHHPLDVAGALGGFHAQLRILASTVEWPSWELGFVLTPEMCRSCSNWGVVCSAWSVGFSFLQILVFPLFKLLFCKTPLGDTRSRLGWQATCLPGGLENNTMSVLTGFFIAAESRNAYFGYMLFGGGSRCVLFRRGWLRGDP